MSKRILGTFKLFSTPGSLGSSSAFPSSCLNSFNTTQSFKKREDLSINVSAFAIEEDQTSIENQLRCSSCEDEVGQIVCISCGNLNYCNLCFEKVHKSVKFAMHRKTILGSKKIPENEVAKKIQEMSTAKMPNSPRWKTNTFRRNCKQNKTIGDEPKINGSIQGSIQEINNQVALKVDELELASLCNNIEKKYSDLRISLQSQFHKIYTHLELMEAAFMKEVQQKKQAQLLNLKKMNFFGISSFKFQEGKCHVDDTGIDFVLSALQIEMAEVKGKISRISVSALMKKIDDKLDKQGREVLNDSIEFQYGQKKKKQKRESNITVSRVQNLKEKRDHIKNVLDDNSNIYNYNWLRNNKKGDIKKVKSQSTLPLPDEQKQKQKSDVGHGSKCRKRKRVGIGATLLCS